MNHVSIYVLEAHGLGVDSQMAYSIPCLSDDAWQARPPMHDKAFTLVLNAPVSTGRRLASCRLRLRHA
eukprot:20152-Eustigmatos_ZCMA.PRE.1